MNKQQREERQKAAQQLYNKTHDILLVKQFLNHKDIRNTLTYLHL